MGKYYDQTAWLKNYRAKIKKKTHSLIYSSITDAEYHLRVKVEHTIQYIYLYIYILYSILVYILVHIHTIQ